MEHEDFRGLGKEAQTTLRRRGVAMVREGRSQKEVAEALGVSRQSVNGWAKRYASSGATGLEDRRTNEHRRDKGSLTKKEAQRVQNWMKDKCPDQMKRPFALWTAQAARELIRRKLGKELGLSTMRLYLKRWGFTSQKPLKRAIQRDPRKIKTWLEKDYPKIAARAKHERAVLYWGDETGINNQDQIGKGYAPKGPTPVLRQTAQKFSTSMIAAVSNRGLVRFKLYAGALNVDLFIDFMKRLIQDARRKVFLIVDNLRVRHAKKVMAWLAARKDRIELFYLPAYAPERNPDAYLNNDLKQQLRNKPRANNRADLVAATRSALQSIQRPPPASLPTSTLKTFVTQPKNM